MMQETTLSQAASEVAKVSPPIAVSAATFFGLTLQEWVYVATLVYTILQIFYLIKDKYGKK